MRNVGLIRRLLLASLIVSLTVPMLYHTVLNYMRREQYGSLTAQVCKAVEPQVQAGAFRTPIEYAQGMMLRQGFDYIPEVEFVDHGKAITPVHKNKINQFRIDCTFAGYPGVRMSIYFESAPILNIRYLYMYLLAMPIFFFMFLGFRGLLNRFQRQVVDLVQLQIKNLLELDSVEVKTNTGTIGRLLDLNIPLLGYLKSHIEGMEERIARYSAKIAEQKKSEVLTAVAAQVTHDIVAPISAIQEILKSNADVNFGDKALLLEELDRMKALTNKMLRQYRGESIEVENENFDLTVLLRIVASEVKMLSNNRCQVDLESAAESILVSGVRSELSAALSNIVKNSLEAMDKDYGKIQITSRLEGDCVFIVVADSGKGISPNDLERIFEKGVSVGKKGGTGLGLYQAKTVIESMDGALSLRSDLGKGTTVEIRLPVAKAISKIEIPVGTKTHLVFVDDDKLVHELWRRVLPTGINQKHLHYFFRVEDFRSWLSSSNADDTLFFIDHDLSKDGPSGIDLIVDENLLASAFLVTGRAHEKDIVQATRERSVRVIDKTDIGHILFNLADTKHADIILIDDARANRLAWEAQAKRANRTLATFASGDDFFVLEESIDRSTPIYVDYFFDGEAVGAMIAEKLVNCGFLNVYLATAYPKDKVRLPRGVRGVVGKEFPLAMG